MKLQDLFASIQRLQDDSGAACSKIGGCDSQCCWVSKMGGEPGVTHAELTWINTFLAGRSSFIFNESGDDACKFLSINGKCKIYEVRPIDCRVHFCRNAKMQSSDDQNVWALVNAYHAAHQAEFLDSLLIYDCRFLGEQSVD